MPLAVQEEANFSFERVEYLAGNIGYLKFNGFADPNYAGDTVAAAMNFLANTRALIIDLRQNRGGNPAMANLVASYLLSGESPVHWTDIWWRDPASKDGC